MLERELILNFHGLGQTPPEATDGERKVWVPVEWFEAIVGALPQEGVSVTFDDGNASDADHALEILTRAGRRAHFFVLADRIGAPGHLTASQISMLHERGMTIGSHGLRHVNWRRLSDDELEAELVDSRRVLEELLGDPVLEAACPFGSYDRRVLRGLRTAGYRRVYTSDNGSTQTSAWLAPRNTVHREIQLERWLELASAGPRWLDPVHAGKRLAKRLR